VFFLWLKYCLDLTACTWLFLIVELESSGSTEKGSFFFQILAKNRGISWYGNASSLNVTTQEKGENNISVMCFIYIYIYSYIPIFEIML
jgi:hypothetical protein